MAAPSQEAEFTHAELLEAQTHVWNQMYSYIFSMSLKAAIQLQIPDVIKRHGKPMTLSQLANSLPINRAKTECIRSLMRILTHSKFFITVMIDGENEEVEEEAYGLTAASRLLVQGQPMSMTSYVLAMTDPVSIEPWHRLSEWFGDEHPVAFVADRGMTWWEFAGADRRFNMLFNESMENDSLLLKSVVVNECRHVFEGLTSMVDVGGGTGMVAKAVAEEFPGLKCIVLDLPHVVAGLKDHQNLSFLKGDMFQFIPPADAILLKWILHDWGDEDCVRLLKRCRDAIDSSHSSDGGKVIIVDIVVKDQQGSKEATGTQFLLDMAMMVLLGGKERCEKEWANLFSAAGFTKYEIHTVSAGLRSVIEVFP